jgi:HPt (histidine-containing phosphotransfer) domain-containing protein
VGPLVALGNGRRRAGAAPGKVVPVGSARGGVSSMVMDDQPVVDRRFLERLHRLGGSALVGQMLTLFREHAPQRVAAVREAVAAQDWPAAGRAAHTMVSTAGSVGALALMQRSRDLEEAVATGRTGEVPGLADLLADALARTPDALDAAERDLPR